MARKASPSTCSQGAGLGAQADARAPSVTVHPGVSTHWTGEVEYLHMWGRRDASARIERGMCREEACMDKRDVIR